MRFVLLLLVLLPQLATARRGRKPGPPVLRVVHQNIGGGRRARWAKVGARLALARVLRTNAAVICLNEAKGLHDTARVRRRYRVYGTRDVAILVRRDITVTDHRVTEVSAPVANPSHRGWGHGRPAAIVVLRVAGFGRVTVICSHLTPARDAQGHSARTAGASSITRLVATHRALGHVVVALDTNGRPERLSDLHDALRWWVAGHKRIDWIGWSHGLRDARRRPLGKNGSDHLARLVRLTPR